MLTTLIGLCCLAAGAPRHDWNNVSYTLAPLVQAGSESLLPAFDAEQGWSLRGRATLGEEDGRAVIRLPAGTDDQRARVQVRVPAQPGMLYRLGFISRFTPDTGLDWSDSYPGLHGWLTPLGETAVLTGPIRLRELRPPGPWRRFETELYTPAGTTTIQFSLDANLATGEAVVAEPTLVEETVPGTEGRQILVAPDQRWGEAARDPEPDAPAQVTVYRRADPDRLFPHSRPTAAEAADPRLTFVGCPGEAAVQTLAVYSPRPLRKLRLDVAGAPPGLDVRVARYQPRRVDYYGRGLTWRWTSDVLLDRPAGVDAEAGRTTVFWLRMPLPDRSAAGNVRLVADGLDPIVVPLEATVRPFTLAAAGTSFGLYPDPNRWGDMTDDQVRRELQDLRSHGIDTLNLAAGGTFEVTDGRVTSFQFGDTERRVWPMLVEAGFRPPYLTWPGWAVRQLPGRLGLREQVEGKSADHWPPALAAATVQLLKLIQAQAEARGWWPLIYVGVDEPGYWKKGSPEQLEWDRQVAKAAGWELYCTSSYLPDDPVGAGIRYHCYGGDQFYPGRAEQVVEATHQAGQICWSYSTGVYSGQPGRLVRNRYQGGFVVYLSGVDGTQSWTFQRPRGNAFDDFASYDQAGEACITYPDPEHPGENLDTPHWEGMRQGWLDYRYLATLRGRLEAAGNTAAARQAKGRLDALLGSMPWGGDVYADGAVTNDRCDAWRDEVADLIEQLPAVED